MRSAADRARVAAEWAAQGAAIVLLAWALLSAITWREPELLPVVGPGDSVQLASWTRSVPPLRIHVRLDSMPSPLERDWVGAFARGGSELSWSGQQLAPVAASIEPLASPSGSERVRVAAPLRAAVVVRDAAGVLDSARAEGGGITLASRTLTGELEAVVGAGAASAAARERVVLRPVAVIGRAQWEAKFVIAALEEEGWNVVARLSVAPGASVEQGSLGAIDTSRYSAVIALDASAADGSTGAAIVRYVRSGGGVVLAGDAAKAAAFRSIAPGTSGEYLPAGPAPLPDSAPRRALSLYPVVLRSPDAIVLERRGERPVAAARRVALGRAMQIGYDDTWRWRMGGGENAPRAHAEWWSSVVSSVAYAPRIPREPALADPDPAPYAGLIAVMGAASTAPEVVASAQRGPRPWMLPVIALLLLGAWASRRLRGAP